MNDINSAQHDYKSDYEQLELDDRADWSQAKTNYRRLVHLWHPDKYAQRPRERKHAQQQFILLTKSYDSLKSFERRNGHLPLEPQNSQRKTQAQAPHEQEPMLKTKNMNKNRGWGHSRKAAAQQSDGAASDQHDFPDDLSPESLARDEAATDDAVIKPNHAAKILWTICGAAMLFATIVLFYMIDRSTNQKIIEKGREAIRAAPASEFMPSNAEIRKSESRGAFIQPPK